MSAVPQIQAISNPRASGAGFGALLSVGGFGTLAYSILTTNTVNAGGEKTSIMVRCANWIGAHEGPAFGLLVAVVLFFPLRAGAITAIRNKPRPRSFWADFTLAALSWTVQVTNYFFKGTPLEETATSAEIPKPPSIEDAKR